MVGDKILIVGLFLSAPSPDAKVTSAHPPELARQLRSFPLALLIPVPPFFICILNVVEAAKQS
ncbi:MAG: hypothetical protein ACD_72C00218G0003 [uncultured bacterium]|nr:MAG: hypothetical protein ACD_72C00218G0003 [uncultured bacterium]